MSDESQKLELPKLCLVPLAARQCKPLSDSAKIYLGELNVLTNKYGYCWAEDKDLAEMKGVSLRTIKSWHRELERHGFISRETTHQHYTVPKEKGVRVRTKRKIYVNEHGSKKVAEGQKSAPRSEGQKSAPRSEGQKSALLLKEEPLKTEQENNNATPPKSPSAVVVPLCLAEMDIPDNKKREFAKIYEKDPERVESACKAVKQGRPRSVVATLTAAIKNAYTPNTTKEDIERQREQVNHELLARAERRKQKVKQIFTTPRAGVRVMDECVEFKDEKRICRVYYTEEDFERKVIPRLSKLTNG